MASQLCLRGYVASLTLKNYPGVDVFAYNPNNEKQVAVQVKASTDGWFNPGTLKGRKGVFVYAHVKADKIIDYYVIPASRVATVVAERLKEYLDSHPNSAKDQPTWVSGEEDFPEYKDKWNILGLKR